MGMDLTPSAVRWIEQSLGKGRRVESAEAAEDATSSTVYFLTVGSGRRRPSATSRGSYVLRLFTNREWLAAEPDLPIHEARALEAAGAAGLPAPRLVAYTEDRDACGAPALLMTRLAGRVRLRPRRLDEWVEEMAVKLAEIHRNQAEGFPWEYSSWTDEKALMPPAWTSEPELWREAIAARQSGPPGARPCFVHRDYHPLNLLWGEGRISGIVDWVNACRGPAGVDLAHCRGNLVQMHGIEAGDLLLEAYRRVVPGYEHHSYWDVDWVLGTLPDPEFYRPWLRHGLSQPAQPLVRRRIEEYLASILTRDPLRRVN